METINSPQNIQILRYIALNDAISSQSRGSLETIGLSFEPLAIFHVLQHHPDNIFINLSQNSLYQSSLIAGDEHASTKAIKASRLLEA